jgi:hypothetical protein
MKHRILRIAWSLFCGFAVVLLIALWVRSYSWHDFVSVPLRSNDVLTQMTKGDIGIWITPVTNSLPRHTQWSIGKDRVSEGAEQRLMFDGARIYPLSGGMHFYFGSSLGVTAIWFPFWAITLPVLLCGTVPWLSWRFSIRTLLITTTLIAVGLGLIVWLS